MTIKSISIGGYRGFSTQQSLKLAVPNGKIGSGLTTLIGPNGGGKSTIIECFQKIATNECSFTEGKRNKKFGDLVKISLEVDNSEPFELKTKDQGGSEAIWNKHNRPKIYHLPARRVFNPYFGKNEWTRDTYIDNPQQSQFRAAILESFSYRLFDALKNYKNFNQIFWRILGKKLEWTIDQNDQNQYYIKVGKNENCYHNSDGLGEGIVSLMFLCDAILDAKPTEILVIDEPELSLHPQLQQRLLHEFEALSATNQIIISTHSPQFISLNSAINNGVIARIYESESGSTISQIDSKCSEYFKSFMGDRNNPHSFGIDARMSLFSEDRLVLTEGQEDVILYPKLMKILDINERLDFWGFGAGGAEKIEKIAYILHKLGFQGIGAIFDADKADCCERFNALFEPVGYKSWTIPADDIRDKAERVSSSKHGILNNEMKINPEYIDSTKQLLQQIIQRQHNYSEIT